MATIFEIVETGATELIKRGLNNSTPDNMVQKYFTNDVTPGFGTVIGDLTEVVDVNYSGYALTGASWVVTSNVDQVEGLFSTPNEIIYGASQTIYGSYLTNLSGTILIGVAKFDAPKNISAGDSTTFNTAKLIYKPV